MTQEDTTVPFCTGQTDMFIKKTCKFKNEETRLNLELPLEKKIASSLPKYFQIQLFTKIIKVHLNVYTNYVQFLG